MVLRAYTPAAISRFGALVLTTLLAALAPRDGHAAFEAVSGVRTVATGFDHSCLIDAAGGVKCWGVNGDGQLGDGSTSNRTTPTAVVGLDSGVAALALGGHFSCALLDSGEVRCWGRNFSGQLGDGSFDQRLTPVAVTTLATATRQLVAGDAHACAILSGGLLKCWGQNDQGQLGDNSTNNRATPAAVVGLSSGVIAVAAGFDHSCAVISGGVVQCWGDNRSGGLGDGTLEDRLLPTTVSGLSGGQASVSAGNRWSCALSDAGAVACWGHNADAELGNGGFEQSSTPVPVTGLQSGVQSIHAGFSANCALLEDASLRCWGQNARGQLGDGSLTRRPLAITPESMAADVAAVSLGGYHTCARRPAGSLLCWGSNSEGQLGDAGTSSRLSAQATSGLGSGALGVELGYQFGCAVTAAGEVRCWGEKSEDSGQQNELQTGQQRVPTPVAGLSGMRAVSSGERHACALSQSGGVACWGLGRDGQLGDGNLSNSLTPVIPLGLESGVAQISVGGNHSCARLDDGSVLCWGLNAYGELGDGSNDSRGTPVAVNGLGAASDIAAGWRHTCAVVAGGAAKCWGDNFGEGFAGGQLGDGSRVSSNVPVGVLAPGVVFTRLSAGGNHTCGLTDGGAVKCWGDNANGELGTGDSSASLTPIDVPGLDAGVQSIAAGGLHPFLDEHSCAVDGNGAVWCWGSNRYGQLGDGTTLMRQLPVASGLSSGMVEVSVGGLHSCARSDTGAVFCWGYDQYGQVGDGSRDTAMAASVVVERRDPVMAASAGGTGASEAVASDAAGRFLVFQSADDALVPGDDNAAVDIFRRDTATGAIERVSLDDAGTQLSGPSLEPAVSANGQFVVLVAADAAVAALSGESKASQAKRLKGTGFGVYLRNLLTGGTQRVGNALPGGIGTQPQIAADGSAVVFTALPDSAQQGDQSKPAVFSRTFVRTGEQLTPGQDAAACLSCKTIAVAGVETGENAAGDSGAATVSADGSWVAFETTAKNLLVDVPSPCPAGGSEIILRNLLTGSTSRVSPPTSVPACGNSGASKPSVDYSGQRVAYQTDAPLAAGDANLAQAIYLHDSRGITQRISSDLGSRADSNGDSREPRISGDGQSVVFRSIAKNLEAGVADNNETDDIFAVRLDQRSTRLISRSPRGDLGNAGSRLPSSNYNGTRIAFDSAASNLAVDASGQAIDSNGVRDIFLVANLVATDIVYRNGLE